MDKCHVLHITKDDKFFDYVIDGFEADGRFENRALLEVKNVADYKFTRIQHQDKVQLVNKKDFVKELKKGMYDAVFFYSLSVDSYKYVNMIPKDKAVIWWTWGSDIYHSFKGMKPFVELPIHKPITANIMYELYGGPKDTFKSVIKKHILRYLYTPIRNRMVKRIDFFQPVIPVEYQLMRKIEGFNGKEFYYPTISTPKSQITEISVKPSNGGVIIGHSQNPDDNHLDVWNDINGFIPLGRKVIIPINYIGYEEYANAISQRIQSKKHELLFLKEFMPKEDYFKLVDSCSYAVYGMVRQQAAANVYYCLRHGIKLFFYKDSIVYQYFKNLGCAVYAIEEIDSNSFVNPLSEIENEQNLNALLKEKEYKDRVRNNSINEICCLFNKKKNK